MLDPCALALLFEDGLFTIDERRAVFLVHFLQRLAPLFYSFQLL